MLPIQLATPVDIILAQRKFFMSTRSVLEEKELRKRPMKGYDSNACWQLLDRLLEWADELVCKHPKGAAIQFLLRQLSDLSRLIMTRIPPDIPKDKQQQLSDGEQTI